MIYNQKNIISHNRWPPNPKLCTAVTNLECSTPLCTIVLSKSDPVSIFKFYNAHTWGIVICLHPPSQQTTLSSERETKREHDRRHSKMREELSLNP